MHVRVCPCRQLANAEKCVERAQMETRQQRSGYGGYEAWE